MKTIRRQLTQRLLLGLSCVLIIGAAVVYLTTRTALTLQFDATLHARTMALSSIIEQVHGKIAVDSDSSAKFMGEFDTTSDAFFQVWRGDGTVVKISPSLRGENFPIPSNRIGQLAYWDLKLTNGRTVRATALKFKPHIAEDSDEQSPPVDAILVVAAERHNLDQALATLALILTGSSLLVLVLTAAIVPWLLRHELAPLDRLAGEAQRITADSLAERFSTDGVPGELAPIGARLNDLLQRLQTAFARERQFSDDLAHEFRTPIAGLRSLAETSLKWPDTRSVDTDRKVLVVALQMEAIINRLLAIARSDMGLATIEAHPLKPADLVSEICKPLQERAAARQLSIHANVPNALEIHSDPVLLHLILANLLDNALEYSKSGSAVLIQGETQNGNFTLGVTNSVQQLDAEDMPHLFERFWRKDAARSTGEHAGLGLPLARAFATSLGYTLSAALNGDGHLTMTLAGPSML